MPICNCGTRYLTRNTDKCVLCRQKSKRAVAKAYRQQARVKARINQRERERYAQAKAVQVITPDQPWADILADVARRRAA